MSLFIMVPVPGDPNGGDESSHSLMGTHLALCRGLDGALSANVFRRGKGWRFTGIDDTQAAVGGL